MRHFRRATYPLRHMENRSEETHRGLSVCVEVDERRPNCWGGATWSWLPSADGYGLSSAALTFPRKPDAFELEVGHFW